MLAGGKGAVMVTKDGYPAGIVTNIDLMDWLAKNVDLPEDLDARDFMQTKIAVVTPNDDVEGCLALMNERGVKFLPVVDEGKLVGIVTMEECVEQISELRRVEVRLLTDYITSRYPA